MKSWVTPGWQYCDVFLDGEHLNYCFEADDRTGEVYCAVLNANGKPIHVLFVSPEQQARLDRGELVSYDGILTEVRRGVVSFTFSNPDGLLMATQAQVT